MTSIADLTHDDYDEWLALWKGYLEFYEATLDDTTTEATFARLIDPDFGIHGAIARDAAGRAVETRRPRRSGAFVNCLNTVWSLGDSNS